MARLDAVAIAEVNPGGGGDIAEECGAIVFIRPGRQIPGRGRAPTAPYRESGQPEQEASEVSADHALTASEETG